MRAWVLFASRTVSVSACLWCLAVFANAKPVAVGDQAPDFDLAATTGGEVKLSDFRGKNMVLLEFYHADWGPT